MQFVPSPNFTKGRDGYKPEAIVIHIMDGTLLGTDSWFSSKTSQVSAHFGIGTQGEVHQYVQEEDTAWHAGRVVNPTWPLIKDGVNPNKYTIGIEHEGGATTEWSPEMINASALKIKELSERWGIPIDREHVIGHYEIRSNKPNCPGTNKAIIDRLINAANGIKEPVPDEEYARQLLAQAMDLIMEAAGILNRAKLK